MGSRSRMSAPPGSAFSRNPAPAAKKTLTPVIAGAPVRVGAESSARGSCQVVRSDRPVPRGGPIAHRTTRSAADHAGARPRTRLRSGRHPPPKARRSASWKERKPAAMRARRRSASRRLDGAGDLAAAEVEATYPWRSACRRKAWRPVNPPGPVRQKVVRRSCQGRGGLCFSRWRSSRGGRAGGIAASAAAPALGGRGLRARHAAWPAGSRPGSCSGHAVQGKDEHGRLLAGRRDEPPDGIVAGPVDLAKRAEQALVIGQGDGAGSAAAVPQLIAGPMGRHEGDQAEVEGVSPHGANVVRSRTGLPDRDRRQGRDVRTDCGRPFLRQGDGPMSRLISASVVGCDAGAPGNRGSRSRRSRRRGRARDVSRGRVDDQATRPLTAQCAPEWFNGKPVGASRTMFCRPACQCRKW